MNNKDKIVAFAGHSQEWHCIGVEDKLPNVLEDLIAKNIQFFTMEVMVLLIKSVPTQFLNLNANILK